MLIKASSPNIRMLASTGRCLHFDNLTSAFFITGFCFLSLAQIHTSFLTLQHAQDDATARWHRAAAARLRGHGCADP